MSLFHAAERSALHVVHGSSTADAALALIPALSQDRDLSGLIDCTRICGRG
jgi:hypothetical protein